MHGGFRFAWVLVAPGCIFGTGDGDDEGGVPLLTPEDFGVVDDDVPPEEPSDFGATGEAASHNEVRATALPTPSPPLDPLTWDPELAEIARQYAQNCRWEHSQAPGLGENLYASTFPADLDEAVESWASEDAYYDYGSNTCTNVCGHYTQVVWRETERVGCGYADCGSIEGLGWSGRVWVCNYEPAGNVNGRRPY